ncbi:MAG: hypothetical protein K9M99_09265 [Candidatus Cloacimonetes bacterium]|nr:hypothetical protein [Candidatus Cloacimonadota bacterium]
MKNTLILLSLLILSLSLWSEELPNNRLIGSWAGYVYNANTQEPIEDATVYLRPHARPEAREYYTVYTDENGYFELINIETDVYDVRFSKWLHYDQWILKGIYEGDNGIEVIDLQKAIGCNYSLYFIPDDYYYESSWGLQNDDEFYWYNETAQGFSSEESVREYVYLEPGNWSIHLYDSYGDGGLLVRITDIEGTIILEEGCSGSHSEFSFIVPEIAGCSCEFPLFYQNINEPVQTGECNGRQEVWYEFYLDNSYSNVTVSLLNSDYDTVLEVWESCEAGSYLAYNDNWSDVTQSQIVLPSLAAGTYYAKISSIDIEESGYYALEISGSFALLYGDVDDNGIVEAFDAANVLQYVVELDPDAVPLPWSDDTIVRANVDGNALIGAYDASLILQYVAGVIDIFPVETRLLFLPEQE